MHTDCTECNATDHRIMDPSGASVGSCICEDGYYDDGVNSLCKICHYSWFFLFSLFNSFSLKCEGGFATNCLSCDAGKYRILYEPNPSVG